MLSVIGRNDLLPLAIVGQSRQIAKPSGPYSAHRGTASELRNGPQLARQHIHIHIRVHGHDFKTRCQSAIRQFYKINPAPSGVFLRR